MSNKQFKYYIATVDNCTGFLGNDVGSGGYPWVASSPLQANVFNHSHGPLDWLGSLAAHYDTLQVMEMVVSFVPVSENTVKLERIASALAKLTDEEKKLLGLKL